MLTINFTRGTLMKPKALVLALLVGPLAAGCQSAPSKKKTLPATEEKKAVPEAEEREPVEPAITPDGFQPLEGWEGELSVESLQERFPGYEAGYTTHSSEGIEYKKYALKKEGEVAVRFSKAERVADIDEVIVYTSNFAGPKGISTGVPYSDLRDKTGPLRCSFGAEDTRWGRCRSERMENLTFLFDLQGVDTGECTIDCVIAEEHLGGEELDAIEWSG